MENWDKAKISQIVGILLSALLALAAVYGYDVKVIQPREDTLSPAEALGEFSLLQVERGTTNLDDLSVASLTSTGAVRAASVAATGAVTGATVTTTGLTKGATLESTGATTVGGPLIQGTTAITLTAGMSITPQTPVYLLSASGAVSMTLTAPAASGQVLYLYGDDNYTITVNDTNILTTDGNAVTIAQYDMVEFMSVGSKWVHVAKSANS